MALGNIKWNMMALGRIILNGRDGSTYGNIKWNIMALGNIKWDM